MKHITYTPYLLLAVALLTGCQTTQTATGNHEVKPDVAYQLADLQAKYAVGDLKFDDAFTNGVSHDSEIAYRTLLLALIEELYGYEATLRFHGEASLGTSPIQITNWQLLGTELKRLSAHWTAAKSRMQISTADHGEFIVAYKFRVALSKTAAAPPSWADELYTSEHIIHALGGFEVDSIKQIRTKEAAHQKLLAVN